MKRHLEHWRCAVCRERGSVSVQGVFYRHRQKVLLERILADHFRVSPRCPSLRDSFRAKIAFDHDGSGWVLRISRLPSGDVRLLVPDVS
ncbi:MAG: hypothetical protein FJW34_00170 [Acidobacteria bacterium]|nr:hypothetical protein [Acidobacteriota bacterium]